MKYAIILAAVITAFSCTTHSADKETFAGVEDFTLVKNAGFCYNLAITSGMTPFQIDRWERVALDAFKETENANLDFMFGSGFASGLTKGKSAYDKENYFSSAKMLYKSFNCDAIYKMLEAVK